MSGGVEINRLPPVLLNAIEMAAHEATERKAVDAGLAIIGLRSRQASDTAAIVADI